MRQTISPQRGPFCHSQFTQTLFSHTRDAGYTQLKRAARNRDFEFLADRYAIERLLPGLAMGPLKPFTDSLAILLSGFEIIEADNANTPLELRSHPPAGERRMKILEFLDGKNRWSLKSDEPRRIIRLARDAIAHHKAGKLARP